jgi:hypothetical protein
MKSPIAATSHVITVAATIRDAASLTQEAIPISGRIG